MASLPVGDATNVAEGRSPGGGGARKEGKGKDGRDGEEGRREILEKEGMQGDRWEWK